MVAGIRIPIPFSYALKKQPEVKTFPARTQVNPILITCFVISDDFLIPVIGKCIFTFIDLTIIIEVFKFQITDIKLISRIICTNRTLISMVCQFFLRLKETFGL
ncbi:hypothetical protein D3C85_977560 [compost metagenome]